MGGRAPEAGALPDVGPQGPAGSSVYVLCGSCRRVLYAYILGRRSPLKFSGPPEVARLARAFGGACPRCGAPLGRRPREVRFMRFRDFAEWCRVDGEGAVWCGGAAGRGGAGVEA